jgi:hypothetical protein
MRRRRPQQADDDSTGLSGWLYTDLLLGLVAVFIGTATFTVARTSTADGTPGDVPETPTTVATTTTSASPTSSAPTTVPPTCTVGLAADPVRILVRSDVTGVELGNSAVFQYRLGLTAHGLPDDSPVGFALAFGAGDGSDGVARATAVMKGIIAQDPGSQFGNVRSRSYFDRDLPPPFVTVDLFAVQQLCDNAPKA